MSCKEANEALDKEGCAMILRGILGELEVKAEVVEEEVVASPVHSTQTFGQLQAIWQAHGHKT